MATRAIKLKLVVPRGDSAEAVADRTALWTLHVATNRAVAAYEKWLLEMRQGDVCLAGADGTDQLRPAESWREALRRRLTRQGVRADDLDEASAKLHDLYRDLVRSFDKPNQGSGQDSSKWHSALCSVDSQAGEQKFELLERWNWLVADDAPPPQWRERLEAQHAEIMAFRPTGSPPTWRRRINSGDPTWPDAFLADLQKKRLEVESDVARRLRQLKALPLLRPVIELDMARGDLNPYDRSALALAVAHLNQWESWRHRVEARRQDFERRLQEADELGQRFADVLPKLRAFEAVRSEQIAAHAFWSEVSTYRITLREIRGWERLRTWIRANPDANSEARAAQVQELQRRGSRDAGATEVLQWLAERHQQDLALHPQGDPVIWLAVRNRIDERLSTAQSVPRFTYADARKHPRFVELDAPTNSNRPKYELSIDGSGLLHVAIPGLLPTGAGYREHRVYLPLAPSQQLREAKLGPSGKKNGQRISFRSQDNLDRSDTILRGAALIFDRSEIERLSGDAFGRAYVKVALDHDKHTDTFKINDRLARYLKGATSTRKEKHAHPTDVRVLGVDLGLRTAAAGAVFRWSGPNTDPAHERSFLLRLPGEDPDPAEIARRQRADDALDSAKRAVERLRDIGRLLRTDDVTTRTVRLESLRATWPSDAPPLPAVGDEPELRNVWELTEAAAGSAVHDLVAVHRDQREAPHHAPVGGKSVWRIEHLERTLRLLRSWDRRQHPDDADVKRFDRARAGTVGGRLFTHITALREDRVKATADLIVQAARGCVYRNGRWERRFDPVNVIVLEDLARYRFRTDRPRRENSQLMRWSHRALAGQVRMQAEVYGIAVDEAPPEFSSRYDAITGVPGVRCHCLRKRDLAELAAKGESHWLARRLGTMKRQETTPSSGPPPQARRSLLDLKTLCTLPPGSLLPTGDGEHFVYPTPNGLSVKHADLNAAQNIACRYLTGFAEPVRVVAYEVPGSAGARLTRRELGKRLGSWFQGKAAVFEATDDGFVGKGVSSSTELPRAAGGTPTVEATEVDHDDDGLTEELAESRTERRVLFRSPGGVIFDPRRWYEQAAFWGRVNRVVQSRLEKTGWRAGG